MELELLYFCMSAGEKGMSIGGRQLNTISLFPGSAQPWPYDLLTAFQALRERKTGWKDGREKEWEIKSERGSLLESLYLCTLQFARLMFWKTGMGKKEREKNANAEKGSAWQDLVWKEYVRIQRTVSNNITNWKFLISQLKTLNTKASCWVFSLLQFAEFASASLETDYASSPNDLYRGFV